MKSYTDLEQSKKLAEILPLESADMWWAERYAGQVMANGLYIVEEKPVYCPSLTKPSNDNYSQDTVKDIPAWSLTALLGVLPKQVILSGSAEDSYWYCKCEDAFNNSFVDSNNPIDVCYEMILKLHKLNLL